MQEITNKPKQNTCLKCIPSLYAINTIAAKMKNPHCLKLKQYTCNVMWWLPGSRVATWSHSAASAVRPISFPGYKDIAC